jgi:hypothetical protein
MKTIGIGIMVFGYRVAFIINFSKEDENNHNKNAEEDKR